MCLLFCLCSNLCYYSVILTTVSLNYTSSDQKICIFNLMSWIVLVVKVMMIPLCLLHDFSFHHVWHKKLKILGIVFLHFFSPLDKFKCMNMPLCIWQYNRTFLKIKAITIKDKQANLCAMIIMNTYWIWVQLWMLYYCRIFNVSLDHQLKNHETLMFFNI